VPVFQGALPVGDGDRGYSGRELSAPEQCDGEGDWRIQKPFLIVLVSIVPTPTQTPSHQTSFMGHRITSVGSSPAFARRSATSASSKSVLSGRRRVSCGRLPRGGQSAGLAGWSDSGNASNRSRIASRKRRASSSCSKPPTRSSA